MNLTIKYGKESCMEGSGNSVETGQANLPIIQTLQDLSLKEACSRVESGPTARVIGPAYFAFEQTAEGMSNKSLYLERRLGTLSENALRTATRYLNQNIFPGQDLEFCFYKVVTEEVFPDLQQKEIEALIAASEAEVDRQRQINMHADGLTMSFKISPERMLKELLWSIRELNKPRISFKPKQ
jgi:hypothetical protein